MPKTRFVLINTLSARFLEHSATISWQPRADIACAGDEWLLKVELAGVRQEDIQLSVRGHRLRLTGVRHDQLSFKSHSPHVIEIAYNRFARVFTFPSNIDSATVRSEYRDGMLYIYLRTPLEC